MSHSKVASLVRRLMSVDLPRSIHRIRLALGLRGLVPRPELLVARFDPPEDSDSSSVAYQAPIKVLVFSHNLSREGASISLKELICGLTHRRAICPEVVSFEDGPLRVEYESFGISVTVLPGVLHKIFTLKRLNREVKQLASLVQASGAELVFVNTLLNFPAILAAAKAGVPSLWNPRESEPWDSYFRFLPDSVAQQAIAAIWLPRRVVFVAHATRKVWEELNVRNNFTVIHNGLNLQRFPGRGDIDERVRCRSALGLEAAAVAVVCVGTLCDRKNQRDLIEALALLPEAIAGRVQIFLVGADHGSYAKVLRERSHSLPLSVRNRIQFFPPTESIDRFYAAADIFVLSSKVESFPRVVLEAMAFGLPIISTPVFGVLEQVCEDENALFYSPGDRAKLAKHIELLVSDEALRKRMSLSSLQRISHMMTFDDMVDAYASVLRQAIAGATQKATT